MTSAAKTTATRALGTDRFILQAAHAAVLTRFGQVNWLRSLELDQTPASSTYDVTLADQDEETNPDGTSFQVEVLLTKKTDGEWTRARVLIISGAGTERFYAQTMGTTAVAFTEDQEIARRDLARNYGDMIRGICDHANLLDRLRALGRKPTRVGLIEYLHHLTGVHYRLFRNLDGSCRLEPTTVAGWTRSATISDLPHQLVTDFYPHIY